jgi:hypothetical protein
VYPKTPVPIIAAPYAEVIPIDTVPSPAGGVQVNDVPSAFRMILTAVLPKKHCVAPVKPMPYIISF